MDPIGCNGSLFGTTAPSGARQFRIAPKLDPNPQPWPDWPYMAALICTCKTVEADPSSPIRLAGTWHGVRRLKSAYLALYLSLLFSCWSAFPVQVRIVPFTSLRLLKIILSYTGGGGRGVSKIYGVKWPLLRRLNLQSSLLAISLLELFWAVHF